MPEPEKKRREYTGLPRYRTWSVKRRYAEAIKKVLYEDYTQSEAARELGITRGRLNEHVKAAREAKADGQAKLAATFATPDVELEGRDPLEGIIRASASPFGLQERRRVGTFEEFDAHYWGSWICPDCQEHHETPQFHRDIIHALEGENPRVLINLPPYHAKSTLVTVKHTVYQIVKDPNHRTIVISKSLPFARTFLHSIAQLLTNPELYPEGTPNLVADWGPFRSDDGGWNTEQIYVAGRVTAEKDPTVQVLGAMGQIYGRRADTIKCDDIATLENQRNPARVSQMLEWLDKEVSSRIGRNGKLVYCGTRVHPGDVYSFLKERPGYAVLRYPLVLDDTNEETLWPEHFTYDMALAKKSEMKETDFQLVYQNIDIPGLGASFTPEVINECKDTDRVNGHYESNWRLIAGLDLAGGSAGSGYTAGVLLGIDLRTGKRYLVDHFNAKSMRAPALKDQIFEWTSRYPIYEWRVENNGLQANLVQYNEEIIRTLALKGVRVQGHNTHNNKWDAEFGVESMAPLFSSGLMSIPWANSPTSRHWQQLVDQLVSFPMGMVSDLVMAFWFADLGCRSLLKRAHLPLFNERMHVPERIRRQRRVVDFSSRTVRPVKEWEKTPVEAGAGPAGYRRMTVGRPSRHDDVRDPDPMKIARTFVNRPGDVPEDTP